jgi:hypothetical protein
VLLKPHVDLLRNNKPKGAHWRGEIGTNFELSQWDDWFDSYETFLMAYASMAADMSVDMLSVNCELAVRVFKRRTQEESCRRISYHRAWCWCTHGLT